MTNDRMSQHGIYSNSLVDLCQARQVIHSLIYMSDMNRKQWKLTAIAAIDSAPQQKTNKQQSTINKLHYVWKNCATLFWL